MVLATQGEKIDKTCFAAYLIWVPLRTREPSLVDLAIQKNVNLPILSLYILMACFTCPFIQFILYMSKSSMWRYWVYFLLAQSFIISDCISQIELGKVCIWYGFTYLFFSPALFIFNQCRKQCNDKCVCIAILYQVYQRCFLSTKAMENN